MQLRWPTRPVGRSCGPLGARRFRGQPSACLHPLLLAPSWPPTCAAQLLEHIPIDPLQPHGDLLVKHAARLGFAWRRAKTLLCAFPEGEVLLDLHAEFVQRLGQHLQPDNKKALQSNIRQARRNVRDAVAYLAPLAVRTSPPGGPSDRLMPPPGGTKNPVIDPQGDDEPSAHPVCEAPGAEPEPASIFSMTCAGHRKAAQSIFHPRDDADEDSHTDEVPGTDSAAAPSCPPGAFLQDQTRRASEASVFGRARDPTSAPRVSMFCPIPSPTAALPGGGPLGIARNVPSW